MSERSLGLLLLAVAGYAFWMARRHWKGRILTEFHPDGFWSRAYATLAWYAVGATVIGLALLVSEFPVPGWLDVLLLLMIPIGGLFWVTGLSLAPWLFRRRRPEWQRAQVAWVRQQEASDDPVPWRDRPDAVRFGSISRAEERARRGEPVRLSDLGGVLEDNLGSSARGADPDPPAAGEDPPRSEAGTEGGSDGREQP